MTELARVEVERRGDRCVIRVGGEIDISNARDLLSAIADELPEGTTDLFLDLTGTTYVDSAGVQLLFSLAERLQARRRAFHLVVPEDSPIRTVLEMTGLQGLTPPEAGLDPSGA